MQTEIINRVIGIGVDKANKSFGRLTAQSVLAGAFIGLGGMLSVMLGYGLCGLSAENPALQRLLSGLAFPVGLFLIVMFGGELFTGNNAMLMPGLARRHYSVGDTLRNWTLVWLGNFTGVLLFTWLFVLGAGLLDGGYCAEALQRMAVTKTSLPWLQILLRGIAANWCVCLAVWLGLSATTPGGKALACWVPVATFVILGYEHCIANMFFIPAGMMAGAAVDMAALGYNLLWATVGNIIGGAVLVGLFFHLLYFKK